MLTRSERQLKARDKTIQARTKRIDKLQEDNAELKEENERLRVERTRIDEQLDTMRSEHNDIVDDLREELVLVKEDFREKIETLNKEKKNDKVLATMKIDESQGQIKLLKMQINKLTADNEKLKSSNKENMAPPLPPPPPQMSTGPTNATQLSQAKYDHFHQTSNDNFRQRHTFKDQKRRHKLAKVYGERLATLEKRQTNCQVQVPINQWNAPQLTDFVAGLPDSAVNRIGSIFFQGHFVTYQGQRCPVETVVLSDKQHLVVEFKRTTPTLGLTMTIRRMREGECVENRNGKKVHFGNGHRQRPYQNTTEKLPRK